MAAKKKSGSKKAKTRTAGKTPAGVAVRALGGHVCRIVLDDDCAGDAKRDDIDRAIESFTALGPSALTDVEEHVFRYYLDGQGDFEPGDDGYVVIGKAADVWKHVQFGGEATVSRRDADGKVYLSLGCSCDWEPEHGLQLVFKEGERVNKVGAFDGHVTNSDAYDDRSLEDVIYRPRGGRVPPAGT